MYIDNLPFKNHVCVLVFNVLVDDIHGKVFGDKSRVFWCGRACPMAVVKCPCIVLFERRFCEKKH
jgi:hypothetical protein